MRQKLGLVLALLWVCSVSQGVGLSPADLHQALDGQVQAFYKVCLYKKDRLYFSVRKTMEVRLACKQEAQRLSVQLGHAITSLPCNQEKRDPDCQPNNEVLHQAEALASFGEKVPQAKQPPWAACVNGTPEELCSVRRAFEQEKFRLDALIAVESRAFRVKPIPEALDNFLQQKQTFEDLSNQCKPMECVLPETISKSARNPLFATEVGHADRLSRKSLKVLEYNNGFYLVNGFGEECWIDPYSRTRKILDEIISSEEKYKDGLTKFLTPLRMSPPELSKCADKTYLECLAIYRVVPKEVSVQESLAGYRSFLKRSQSLINMFGEPRRDKSGKPIQSPEENAVEAFLAVIKDVDVFQGFDRLKADYELFLADSADRKKRDLRGAIDAAYAQQMKVDPKSLLIIPIQRFPRYGLFSDGLSKALEKVQSQDYETVKALNERFAGKLTELDESTQYARNSRLRRIQLALDRGHDAEVKTYSKVTEKRNSSNISAEEMAKVDSLRDSYVSHMEWSRNRLQRVKELDHLLNSSSNLGEIKKLWNEVDRLEKALKLEPL